MTQYRVEGRTVGGDDAGQWRAWTSNRALAEVRLAEAKENRPDIIWFIREKAGESDEQ